MITVKSSQEIKWMRESGRKLGEILETLINLTKPGLTGLDIEEKACQMIKKAGGKPSFTTVSGYKWATCICVNNEIVHGIPTLRKFCPGDILTIDIGMLYKGMHTDTANSFIVGKRREGEYPGEEKFLATGRKTLYKAIGKAISGNRIGDISRVIQESIENSGYKVISSLVGHGIGKKLHEFPQIPGWLKADVKETPLLRSGNTIAIEVIYSYGSSEIVSVNDDGWTLGTEDGSISAVFEHTVCVTGDKPEILTIRPEERLSNIDQTALMG